MKADMIENARWGKWLSVLWLQRGPEFNTQPTPFILFFKPFCFSRSPPWVQYPASPLYFIVFYMLYIE
jgi:hypothetical protein